MQHFQLNQTFFSPVLFQKRWKSLVARLRLYGGCSNSSKPRYWRQTFMLLIVWGQALSWSKIMSFKFNHIHSIWILALTVTYNSCCYPLFYCNYPVLHVKWITNGSSVFHNVVLFSSIFLQKWVFWMFFVFKRCRCFYTKLCCLLLYSMWWVHALLTLIFFI